MLTLDPSSSCDICLESYTEKLSPYSIPCGHVFCLKCLDALTPRTCPLCRHGFLPQRVRRIHYDSGESQARLMTPTMDTGTEELKAYDMQEKIAEASLRDGAPQMLHTITEVEDWLRTQPRDQHIVLRSHLQLLLNFHTVMSTYMDEKKAAEDHEATLQDRLKMTELEWKTRFESALKEARILRQELIKNGIEPPRIEPPPPPPSRVIHVRVDPLPRHPFPPAPPLPTDNEVRRQQRADRTLSQEERAASPSSQPDEEGDRIQREFGVAMRPMTRSVSSPRGRLVRPRGESTTAVPTTASGGNGILPSFPLGALIPSPRVPSQSSRSPRQTDEPGRIQNARSGSGNATEPTTPTRRPSAPSRPDRFNREPARREQSERINPRSRGSPVAYPDLDSIAGRIDTFTSLPRRSRSAHGPRTPRPTEPVPELPSRPALEMIPPRGPSARQLPQDLMDEDDVHPNSSRPLLLPAIAQRRVWPRPISILRSQAQAMQQV